MINLIISTRYVFVKLFFYANKCHGSLILHSGLYVSDSGRQIFV